MSNKEVPDSVFSGYTIHTVSDDENRFRSDIKFLLPHRLAERLKQEKIEAEIEAARKEKEERDAAKTEDPEPSGWLAVKKKKEALEIDQERAKLTELAEKQALEHSRFRRPVYDCLEPLKLIASARSADKDGSDRSKKVYEILAKTGNYRDVRMPDESRVFNDLERLKERHPSFEQVISFVAKHIGLAFKSEQVLKIPPILLTGPPGLGKTHFAKDLASALCAPMHQLSFDSALASAALMGSDKNWGNTTSGIVFDAVVGGNDPVANPVILLDEVDKARDGGHYQSPISSLHSLLEPISSKSVMDISLSFIFDSSMVTWIACANHLELIATTIRSRFHIFEIKPPTGWAAVQLARCVAAACHEELAIEDFIKPGRDLIRLIFHLSAREQRKAWEDAFASAISDNRKHLEASDLPNDEPPTKPGKPNEWMH